VTLTFVFDLKTGVRIARGVGNLPTNFGVSRSFRSRLIDQHLSDASRDLATLTLSRRLNVMRAIVLHRVPSLKFVLVGLPVRKYWAFTV